MYRVLFVLIITVAVSAAASAQSGVSGAVKSQWDGAKRLLIASAEQMPEKEYAFKPVETVRSFGAILAHVAGANYVFCASALGEKSPFAEEHFEKTATTKAAIVKAVQDSVAYCDKAYGAATEQSLGEMVAAPFGSGKQSRASSLIGNTGHVQEHYGNLVTYFRIRGMVPPSSRSQ
jgi:uncharacterized damage-inducible protein DinB